MSHPRIFNVLLCKAQNIFINKKFFIYKIVV
jgi:hypothetical protein